MWNGVEIRSFRAIVLARRPKASTEAQRPQLSLCWGRFFKTVHGEIKYSKVSLCLLRNSRFVPLSEQAF
jgi:hypothetical protein